MNKVNVGTWLRSKCAKSSLILTAASKHTNAFSFLRICFTKFATEAVAVSQIPKSSFCFFLLKSSAEKGRSKTDENIGLKMTLNGPLISIPCFFSNF